MPFITPALVDDDDRKEGGRITAAAPLSPVLACVDGGGGIFHLMVGGRGSLTAPERLKVPEFRVETPKSPRLATAPEGAKGTIGPIEARAGISGLIFGTLERRVVGAAGMP